MIAAGKIAVLRFPRTDLGPAKPRPVLLLARLPGPYDDWLSCMLSTQVQQAIAGFDEVIREQDDDFSLSGLHVASAVRIARLAVVGAELFEGAIGEIGSARLARIRRNLSEWLLRSP